MRRDEISGEFEKLAFEYFYWFSRFEFALKEKKYLLSDVEGAKAKPNWDKFVKDYENGYKLSQKAKEFLEHAPKQQYVGSGKSLVWKAVRLDDKPSELGKIIRYLNTARNNLFHGGKSDSGGWDNSKRNLDTLELGLAVLNEIADISDVQHSYTGYY